MGGKQTASRPQINIYKDERIKFFPFLSDYGRFTNSIYLSGVFSSFFTYFVLGVSGIGFETGIRN